MEYINDSEWSTLCQLFSLCTNGNAESVEILRIVAGKNVRARLGHLNWPEQVFFGWPDRTDGMRP